MREFCANTLPFHGFPLETFLGELAGRGISAIELSSEHFDGLDAPAAERLQEQTGTRFKSILSPADIAAPDGLADQRTVLDIAEKLSIPMVCTASGGAEEATDAEIDTIIERLSVLAREGADRGITVALYTHQRTMAYNLARTERVFEAAPDALRFYYSPYHFQQAGDDPVMALECCTERLCNVYFNCGIDPVTSQAPIWAPEMDYPAICAALEETGYCEEMMLLYLGLDVEAPMPIVEGIGKARSFLEACF